MKSLLDHILELKPNNWDYYKKRTNSNFSPNIMKSSKQEDHKYFFVQYFVDGEKSEILNDFFNAQDDFKRSIHTNSIFFLGCLLYKKLELSNKIDFYSRKHDQFYFIWFLTSLAHDFAYKYEDNFNKYKDSISKDIFNLKHNLISTKNKCNKPYREGLVQHIPEYFKSRLKQCKIDHGIVAGMKLYDSLVKNRIIQKEKFGVEDKERNLYWGDDLDPLYHCASIAVATHNIWQNDKNKDLFPVSLENFPLLLLLGLVDTLDPVKTFDCVDPVYVLENILIEFENLHTIEIKNADDSKLDFNKLIKKVDKLDEWLNVEVDIHTDNSIKIMIKNDEEN